jgi:hypothetical protein
VTKEDDARGREKGTGRKQIGEKIKIKPDMGVPYIGEDYW